MSVSSVFFLCPAPSAFQFVFLRAGCHGNPQGLSDCLSSPCETRVFPGTSVRGRKYASLVEVGFTFCQCQDALWLMVVKANLSGETLIISNPPLFNKSLTSYLRLLILRLEAGVPSKEILIEYGIEFRE